MKIFTLWEHIAYESDSLLGSYRDEADAVKQGEEEVNRRFPHFVRIPDPPAIFHNQPPPLHMWAVVRTDRRGPPDVNITVEEDILR